MPILLLFLQLVLRIVSKLNLTTHFAIFYVFMMVCISSCLSLLFEYDSGDKPDRNRKQSMTYYFAYHELKLIKEI